jgi:hypothetical protein
MSEFSSMRRARFAEMQRDRVHHGEDIWSPDENALFQEIDRLQAELEQIARILNCHPGESVIDRAKFVF